MVRKSIRIPDSLNKEFEEKVKMLGLPSANEGIIKAIEDFVAGTSKEVRGPELIRAPIDTECSDPDCKKEIRFGAWCYYHPKEGTLCPECGVKRGWTGKDRIRRLIQNYELRLDSQELKREIKDDLQQWADLKDRINIWKLGERHEELEQQKNDLVKTALDFMRQDFVTPKEKESIKKLLDKVEEIEKLQEKVREEIASRMKIFDKKKKKRKKEAIPGVI